MVCLVCKDIFKQCKQKKTAWLAFLGVKTLIQPQKL